MFTKHAFWPGCVMAWAIVCIQASALRAQDDVKTKIAALEKKVRAAPKNFDWGVHNELRHLYGAIDPKKSFHHCDVILLHRPMDGYILDILGARGWADEPGAAAERLLASATKYPQFKFVTAACWLKSAELLAGDKARGRALLKQIAAMKGAGLDYYRTAAAARLAALDRPITRAPWTIPVLVVNYFPLTPDKQKIDIKVTANVGAPLKTIEAKCKRMTQETIAALEAGSRFRPYRNVNAEPSLQYKVVGEITYYEPVPHHLKKKNYTDYNKIMQRANVKDWVERKGVREIWIWGYHSKQIAPVESNMASVHGNVSNSHRDPFDLPILKHTYTVYHYNYERGASMAVHNHLHQIEAVMRHHGGDLWKRFEGKPGAWRAGNCHFPVNGKNDYDYANKAFVESDIEDWRPEGFGKKQKINCDRWHGDDMKWYVYWMQAIPGAASGLTFQNRPLSNWWEFLGDYDQAVRRKTKFTD